MRLAFGLAITHLALSSLFMISSEANSGDVPVSIWVWNDRNLEQHFAVLEVHRDGPCGATVRIEVTQLPAPRAAREIGFELVVEYRQNDIVRRWATPANLVVSAVAGDFIYVDDWSRSLKIGSDGSIEITQRFIPELECVGEYPESVKAEIPGSAYLRCFAFKDLESGETRTIGFQGPCT